jgi:type I restriction enzyme S subunit
MKEGWVVKPLGDVLQPTVTKNPLLNPDKEFEYIDVSSVSNQTFKIEETQRLIGRDAPSRARRLVQAGDILFATIRPTLMRIAMVPEELNNQVCSTGYFVLKPQPEVYNRFLFYWLFSETFTRRMEQLQKGASYPAVNDTDVRSQKIVFPSLNEQHRIVAKLDEAFEAISSAKEKAEQNLLNARALFDSYLDDAFNIQFEKYPPQKLGDVAIVQSGGTPTSTNKAYWGGEIPWYASGELNDTFTRESEKKITTLGLENSNAKLFSKGSLLIGMYDTAALKMSILDRDGAFNQAISGVKPNPKLNLEYVLHSINSIKPRLLLERRGVRQKNLNLGKIKDISIPIPELRIQNKLVEKIREIKQETQQLETLYQQKVNALDELKKSLLHQAFSGEL